MKNILLIVAIMALVSCKKSALTDKISVQSQLPDIKELTIFLEEKGKPISTRPGKVLMLLYFDGYYVNPDTWSYNTYQPSGATPAQVATMIDDIKLYYSLWDIEVTTDVSRWSAYPANKRGKVVIAGDCCDIAFAGIAAVNSIPQGKDIQAVVYFRGFAGDIRLVANAVVHEFAHSLGLNHQALVDKTTGCTVLEPYINMPVIMGRYWAYPTRPVWTVGTTQYCTIQDDKKKIGEVIKKSNK